MQKLELPVNRPAVGVPNDRRAGARVPCRVLVHHAEGSHLRLFETIEISETGCLLRARSPGRPAPGTWLSLEVLLPGQAEEVLLTGRIVGEVGTVSDIFALTFSQLEPRSRSSLIAFVGQTQLALACRERFAHRAPAPATSRSA